MSGGAQDAENGRTRGTLLRGGRSLEGGVAATEPRHGERACGTAGGSLLRGLHCWGGGTAGARCCGVAATELRHGGGLAAAGGRDGAAAWRTGCDSTARGPWEGWRGFFILKRGLFILNKVLLGGVDGGDGGALLEVDGNDVAGLQG